MSLSEQQLTIKYTPCDKNMCIMACAGSGKTTTILHRIEYLIKFHGVCPTEIMLTAFNNSAAEDMTKRLFKLVPDSKGIWIGTIDSLAASILNKHQLLTDKFYHVKEYIDLFNQFLTSEESIKFKSSIKYLFIDEFQDINDAQFAMINKFYLSGTKITVVGDDYQNIYTFRDSNIEYILKFEQYFDNAVVRFLDTNYRSTPEIINIANDVIKNNKSQFHKNMFPFHPSGSKPQVINIPRWQDQYPYILKIITRLNVPFENIAILSRNNSLLYDAEAFFSLYGIPNILLETHDDGKTSCKQGHITLCTIHKSKGLEWDVVFIVGLHDKYFPFSVDNVEEERRLFYVAVTRAKKELFMFLSSTPTRFVKEIHEENMKLIGIDYPKLLSTKEVVADSKEGTPPFSINMLSLDELRSLKEKLNKITIKQTKIAEGIKIPTYLSNNALYAEFFLFLTHIIKKQKCTKIKLSEKLKDILYTVKLTKSEYEAYQKCTSFDDLHMKSNLYANSLTYFEQKVISKASLLDIPPRELIFKQKGHKNIYFVYEEMILSSIMKFIREPDWKRVIYDCYITTLACFVQRNRLKGLFTGLSPTWIKEIESDLITLEKVIATNFEESTLNSNLIYDELGRPWTLKPSDEIKIEWLYDIVEAERKSSIAFIFNPISGTLFEVSNISID